MKCPGVHCPGCNSETAGIASAVVMIIGAALLYKSMGAIAAFLRIMAEIVVGFVGVITVSILAVIAVKIRKRRRIYARYDPINAVEYQRIKRSLTRERLVAAGIIKTVPVSITHTMKEIPPKMKDTVTAEILESSHMILPNVSDKGHVPYPVWANRNRSQRKN